MTAVLSVVIVVLFVLLLAACRNIEVTQAQCRSMNDAGQRTMLAIAAGARDADVLRRAADDWDDPTGADRLRHIASKHYQVGGPSMPAIWLRLRADEMDPALREDDDG